MKKLIFLIALITIVFGCKTSSKLKQKTEVKTETKTELKTDSTTSTATKKEEAKQTDTAVKLDIETLNIKLSPPDSSGKQYPTEITKTKTIAGKTTKETAKTKEESKAKTELKKKEAAEIQTENKASASENHKSKPSPWLSWWWLILIPILLLLIPNVRSFLLKLILRIFK